MSATKPWQNHQPIIKKYLDEYGIEDILREPTIHGTMFVGNIEFIDNEYAYLLHHKYYNTVWQKAIKDDGTGNPERYFYNDSTSGNYIHCAHHLAKFQQTHGIMPSDLTHITEVGAGYGAMCKVCRQAGFTGSYTLFDLPVVNEIQRQYLKYTQNNEYVSDIRKLKVVDGESMFISTWAISEMPSDYRTQLLEHAKKHKYILIAYQKEFEGMDLEKYFDNWIAGMPSFSWVQMNVINDNHNYLFGRYFYG